MLSVGVNHCKPRPSRQMNKGGNREQRTGNRKEEAGTGNAHIGKKQNGTALFPVPRSPFPVPGSRRYGPAGGVGQRRKAARCNTSGQTIRRPSGPSAANGAANSE